jgi:hypothetical protein
MDIYSQIKQKIKSVAGGNGHPMVFAAQVVSASGTTCTVKIDELTVTDVRLRAVVNTSIEQLLVVPKAGSYVLIVDLSGGNYSDLAVIAFSEVESVSIKIGDMTAVMDANGIVFNGGQLNGLVKIQELKDNLNALKQYVEAINSALPTAFNAILAGTAANGALGATSYQGAMAGKVVQIKDMENDKIKQ